MNHQHFCFRAIALLIVGAVLLIAVRLHLPFLEPEEGRYAEIPRQMLATNSLLVPVLDGQVYLDKPPLTYWLNIGSYQLFGPTTYAARIMPCVIAWLTVVVVMSWGYTISGRSSAIATGVVLLTCPDFLYRGPMLTPNGLLALLVTVGWATGQIALTAERRWPWWLASAFATSLGVLAKGPVALMLVGTPLFLAAFVNTKLGSRRWLIPFIFSCTVAILSAPWFIAVARQHPEFLEYFFWKHNVQRALDPVDHYAPFWYYIPRVVLGAGPWIIMLAIELFRNKQSRRMTLPLIATAFTFVFLSLVASKRPVYLLPVYPALAVGVGTVVSQWRLFRWQHWPIAMMLAASLIGAIVWLPSYHRRFSLREPVDAIPANIARSCPIICYPHDWPSAGFRLQRNDLVTFPQGTEAALLECIAAKPETILILKDGKSAIQLIDQLPTNQQWIPVGESGVAVLGIVRRR